MRKSYLLKEIKQTQVYIDKEKPLTVPVCWCCRGLPVVLPKRPQVFWCRKQGRSKHGYLKGYCGFDIETTNIIKPDRKRAYMYIWQMAICTDSEGIVYLGRTWDDFLYLLDHLQKEWQTSEMEQLIMWDANFGFEFQFIRKKLEWDEAPFAFFAKEERKPLTATWKGIQFHECLTISGGSLGQLAKDYTTTQKLKGDLDYSVIRNHKTALTEQELDYCINDVVILSEWSKFVFENWLKTNKKVPLTKTGLLRSETKQEWSRSCTDKIGYMQMMNRCYPDELTYKQWFRWLFRGGYVHSNCPHTNRILENILPEDITSSYPTVIFLTYCPGSEFVEVHDFQNFRKYAEKKCCIFLADFYGLQNTGTHSLESLSKCIEADGYRLDNGRIYRADHITVMLTELDLDNYDKFYTWDRMHIRRMWVADRMRFPGFLRKVLKKHYVKKSELKKAGLNHTPEYAITKSSVNSIYGLTVTKMQLDEVAYSQELGWHLAEVPLEYEKEAAKQILLPQWGIWVAAQARHNLMQQVAYITERCGNVVVYCDTDSIKCLPHPELEDCFKVYNDRIAKQLKQAGLTDPAFYDLGMFTNEAEGHTVTRFKTLGAKRYLMELDGEKIEATIAGFPKSAVKAMGKDPFDAFSINGMKIEAGRSEKLTTAYIDEPSWDWVAGEVMEEDSSVALYEIPFSLITDKRYYELLVEGQERRQSLGVRTDG